MQQDKNYSMIIFFIGLVFLIIWYLKYTDMRDQRDAMQARLCAYNSMDLGCLDAKEFLQSVESNAAVHCC